MAGVDASAADMGRGLPRGLAARARAFLSPGRGVPLARRNLLANRRRLLRSTIGIAFAVLLMLVELGFRDGFLESNVQIIRRLDGDIVLVSSTKLRFGNKDAFSRRQLYQARGVAGVASAAPLYAEWSAALWKNPQTRRLHHVQVLAFDPSRPVFADPDINARLAALRQPDTVMFDRRGKRFLGAARAGTVTELARRRVRVVGTFALGPDFTDDGTMVMSDRNFFTFFSPHKLSPEDLPDPEFGIIKVLPDYRVEQVQAALRRALPGNVAVLTKDQLIAHEIRYQTKISPIGPVFGMGAAIGFAVGLLISYQTLYNDLSEQLPQYATLKAIGFANPFLVRIVLAQAVLYALAGFVPAWLFGNLIFYVLREISLLPLRLTAGITVLSAALTLGMCLLSAWLALRRVIAADPAEVF